MAEFSTTLKDLGGINTIYLKGFLDAHTAPVLENVFANLIDKKQYSIVVNFNELAYISSAGLGVFMAFIERIRDNNGDIKLAAMTDKVYNIFDLLGFPLLYEIYRTEDEAVSKFKENKNIEKK